MVGYQRCRLPSGDEVFWVVSGACGLVALMVVVGRLGCRAPKGGGERKRTSRGGRADLMNSLYGPLLERPRAAQQVGWSTGEAEADVSAARWHVAEGETARGIGEGLSAERRRLERRVDRWISFASTAEALYAVLFLGLAVAFAFHVLAHRFSWLVELGLLLAMLGAKITVVIALAVIHCHLSADARSAAGIWLLVLGGCKLATASCAFSFLSPLLFLTSLDHDAITMRDLCKALKLSSVPSGGVLLMLMASSSALVVLQFRISRALHERACDERELGIGVWWRLLVLSNCATCVLWYFGSVLVMVTMWGFYSAAPAAGVMFLLMALAQMTTGLSLHQINKALKAYFSSGAATNSAEPVELMERGGGAGGDAAGYARPELLDSQGGYISPLLPPVSDLCHVALLEGVGGVRGGRGGEDARQGSGGGGGIEAVGGAGRDRGGEVGERERE
jgi:hypothetical protein